MKKLLLVLLTLCAINIYAQQNVTRTIDFEPEGVGADWNWSVVENSDNPPLEIISNPVSTTNNSSATVAKFTARADGNAWALLLTDDNGEFTIDATNAIVKIMVYKTEISNVAFKLEGGTAIELSQANTIVNDWEELTYDFSAQIGNSYSKIVIIPDFADRAQENIIYLDNIQLPEGVVAAPAAMPTVQSSVPTQDQSNVISIYCDVFTPPTNVDYNPGWGQSTSMEIVEIESNPILMYGNLSYQGTTFDAVDASQMDYLHVEYWTPDGTVLRVSPINSSLGVEAAYDFGTLETENWVSVDIPISYFTTANSALNFNAIDQFKFDSEGTPGVFALGTFYIDNVFFYKEAPASGLSITAPTEGSTFVVEQEIEITASAINLSGTIQQVDFYQNDILIGSDDSAPYTINWSGDAIGSYTISAKATDTEGTETSSQSVNITLVDEILSCSETSNEAQQGEFEIGYKAIFETVGTSVNVSFELYDVKNGLLAFLWEQEPFNEISMELIEGNKFGATLSGQTVGETINLACKFAYEGGLSVTKYISYTVGESCDADTEIPSNFTAIVGDVNQSTIELKLSASDNEDLMFYDITYDGDTKTVSANSGELLSYNAARLVANTTYSFSIVAYDKSGNMADNNPIVLEATTLADNNTACAGNSFEASEGDFDIGYNYTFASTGTDVDITFELLDDEVGTVAFLWNTTSGFVETQMTESDGLFTIQLNNQVIGTELQLSAKFAFSGGLAATKTFTYTVGDNCTATGIDNKSQGRIALYPNPVQSILNINLPSEVNVIKVFNMQGNLLDVINVNASSYQLNMSTYPAGVYFISTDEHEPTKVIKQ